MGDDAQDSVDGPGDGLLNITVIEDDVRALATELESDLLEVRVRRGLHDLASNEGAASEGDLSTATGPDKGKWVNFRGTMDKGLG